MIDVDRRGLITTVSCRNCRASMTIETDHPELSDRSVSTFESRHRCRPSLETEAKQSSTREVMSCRG